MIPRYDKKEISDIWTDNTKFQFYLDAELAILRSQEESGSIPSGISEKIKNSAKIIPERVDEIEKVTKHDVIAFCQMITEQVDTESGKYFHFGVTSSDIIDTALTLQIKSSIEKILPIFSELRKHLLNRATELKNTMTIGRSHGMFAEPMSFGQKLLGHYCEFSRRYFELKDFYENELTAQFSGAVGNYTILTPENEKRASQLLNLKVEPVSTQVIPRDRIAKLVQINSRLGAAIERISVEIRHLHRSDVGELHEGFSKGQKGSSTMPHKKNPISAENLTGMARMLKSHSQLALENIVLWHERDISHSSAERMFLPDNLGITFYALDRLSSTIENLVFHQENIENRVFENFTYLSSYILHQLVRKTSVPREELYYWVQEGAFEANKSNDPLAFQKVINEKSDGPIDIEFPSKDDLKNVFLRHVDTIFTRSLEQYPL